MTYMRAIHNRYRTLYRIHTREHRIQHSDIHLTLRFRKTTPENVFFSVTFLIVLVVFACAGRFSTYIAFTLGFMRVQDPVPLSIPFCRNIRNCSGVRIARHSDSDLVFAMTTVCVNDRETKRRRVAAALDKVRKASMKKLRFASSKHLKMHNWRDPGWLERDNILRRKECNNTASICRLCMISQINWTLTDEK